MSTWLEPDESRIGLGCMRLSTVPEADEERAEATIEAALAAGISVFDTARAYGENEALLARVIRREGAESRVRIATKGGMSRPAGAWVPDGRARSIRADCETSLEALDGLPIDLYLLHAPDPRTPLATSVRALARLLDEGLVHRVGVCNVNRAQLDEAASLAPLAAVQVGVSLADDRALRGGVVERCSELGLTPVAHSPLGGPRRNRALLARPELARVAEGRGATPAQVALAWVLGLGAHVVAIPGARSPEAATEAAAAAPLTLSGDERERLYAEPRRRRAARQAGDVVLVMGIPGSGKSRVAARYVDRGYLRLNRDERGGTLRDLAAALDDALAAGTRTVVLDNTYLTRESRSHVVEVAGRHGVAARAVWLDTPLAHAQAGMVERLLDHFDGLPTPEQLKAASRTTPGLLTPTQQMRALRELEPPGDDEGFAEVEHVPFVREERPGAVGVFVAAAALDGASLRELAPDAPHLVFDWRPGGDSGDLGDAVGRVGAQVAGPVDAAVCPHPGGPPVCWCRPPLPGLLLAFARAHGLDPARSLLVGTSRAHRTLAEPLGARYVEVALGAS